MRNGATSMPFLLYRLTLQLTVHRYLACTGCVMDEFDKIMVSSTRTAFAGKNIPLSPAISNPVIGEVDATRPNS